MDMPDAVAEFIEEAIVLGHPLLPHRYPDADDVEAFQDILPPNLPADRWLALCCNDADEPFLLDPAAPDGPVYFASALTTSGEALPVAESLEDFADLIGRLQDLEADPCDAAGWIERHLDPDNDLWAEVASGYRLSARRLETLPWHDDAAAGAADAWLAAESN
ncbi:MAG: hypothetical protein LBH76_01565 [Propionibacteriaceae bacterium]|jgi:hypothetical protein|nr:hypothetical protein [Propionibacteriaceae bacterium]